MSEARCEVRPWDGFDPERLFLDLVPSFCRLHGLSAVDVHVEETEAQLSLREETDVRVLGREHLLQEFLRKFLGMILIVSAEELQTFLLPAPVLVHLGRSLHEIRLHPCPCEARHLCLRQHLVEDVTELMDHRDDIAVREE